MKLLPALTFLFLSVTSFAAEKPNVLLILVDDLKPSLGAYGDEPAITPHMDALAAESKVFERAYCDQPVCTASRNSLMLGTHPNSSGLYFLRSDIRSDIPNAVTMPQFFAEHGYRTESLGKVFHIGHGTEGDPSSFQVPHFKDKVIEYVDPTLPHAGVLTREEAYFQNERLDEVLTLPKGMAYESPDVPDHAYADGRVAEEAGRRLKEAAQRLDDEGTPFFMAVGFARPHLPFSAPQKYWDLYDPEKLPIFSNATFPEDGVPAGWAHKIRGEIHNYAPVEVGEIDESLSRELVHGYYASTSFVDRQIGKVLESLGENGLKENTIVVLWGDHGFHLGDKGIWTKHTNYEEANRIPLLFRVPELGFDGAMIDQFAQSMDVYPTLAGLAGLSAPDGPQGMTGESLVPVLKDPQQSIRDHAFHLYPTNKLGRAIRTERYRLVEWTPRDGSMKDPAYELFDYKTDPQETKNHAADKPEVVEQLAGILATYPNPKPARLHLEYQEGEWAPEVAGRPLKITFEIRSPRPHGVVVSHGGSLNGYSVFFRKGIPHFAVRREGKLSEVALEVEKPLRGLLVGEAVLDEETMSVSIVGVGKNSKPSPGLLAVQPPNDFSVAEDRASKVVVFPGSGRLQGYVIHQLVDGGGKAPRIARPRFEQQVRETLAARREASLIKSGWIRDPFITTGNDGFYYLTGTTLLPRGRATQTDPYNTGLGSYSLVGYELKVWRSPDLVTWEPYDAGFSLSDGIWAKQKPELFQADDKDGWHLWAPELHQFDEGWALVHTSPSPVDAANFCFTSNASPSGNWKNPFGEKIGKRHDPSLFQDDDGSVWLVWGATKIAKLNEDLTDFVGDTIEIGPSGSQTKMGHEGCLIRKINGKYVLFGTGWSTGEMRQGSYNLYYAVADRIEGPYSERKFAGRFLGHGTPFQDKDGQWWCTGFYNANVPPLSRKGIEKRDIGATANTINQLGVTLVPMHVGEDEKGDLVIRAIPSEYATPGPDEAQKFN